MSDLISRKAVIKLIHESADDFSKLVYGMVDPYDLAFKVGHLPSAEPERQSGKWTTIEAPKGYCNYMACTVCQTKFVEEDYNFCPECGADMRGEEDET